MFFPLFQSAISISGIDGVMSSSSSMYGCSRNRDLFLGPTSLLGPLVALGQKMNNSGFQQMWSSRETSLHLEPLISLFSLIPDFSCLFSLAKRAIANSAHALFTSGCKSIFFSPGIPYSVLKAMPQSVPASKPHVETTCFRKNAKLGFTWKPSFQRTTPVQDSHTEL